MNVEADLSNLTYGLTVKINAFLICLAKMRGDGICY
jgi:hypothetical protein